MRSTILALVGILASSAAAFAETHYETLAGPGQSAYFGHVAWCEVRGDGLDPRVARDGAAETATVNVPFAPGDRLLTSEGRRCEVEFDTGTVVQLDGATGVRLETVLAPSLSSERRLTNLVLEAGTVRIRYRTYGRGEVFQVLTANAAIKLDQSAVVKVAATEQGETRFLVEGGKAALLFGPNARKVRQRYLKTGESLSIRQDQAFEAPPPIARDEFAHWGSLRDRERTPPPASGWPLSASIRSLPPAVVDFAERHSLAHGRWVWTNLKQHAWRPHLNEEAGWRPYTRGRWTAVAGQPFWVAEEPWGWVPYHLGYWYHEGGTGWVWLPGSTFAPAWVTWTGCGDSLLWRPFGPEDWLRFRRYGSPQPPWCEGLDSAWYGYPWSSEGVDLPARPVQYAKRRSGSDPEPPSPSRPRPERPALPRELRRLGEQLDRLTLGLAPSDLERDARPTPPPDVPRSQVLRVRERPDADDEAGPRARTHAGDSSVTPVTSSYGVVMWAGPERPAVEPTRFRDWNPDVRVALEQGVSLRYDSRQNRVVCEGCRVLADGGFALGGSGTGSTGGSDGSTGSGPVSAAGGADRVGSGGGHSHTPIER